MNYYIKTKQGIYKVSLKESKIVDNSGDLTLSIRESIPYIKQIWEISSLVDQTETVSRYVKVKSNEFCLKYIKEETNLDKLPSCFRHIEHWVVDTIRYYEKLKTLKYHIYPAEPALVDEYTKVRKISKHTNRDIIPGDVVKYKHSYFRVKEVLPASNGEYQVRYVLAGERGKIII